MVLAAAALAGVDRVFALGGAGAIAAMAYGTAVVPRVDRIVGPGNAYVAEAKLQVASVVAIDSPAGPSELLVIADDSRDAARVARELLAQAEHDPRRGGASSSRSTRRVAHELERSARALLAVQPRREIIAAALATRGAVLLVRRSLDEAIAFANEYAPEHLLLAVARSETLLAGVRNAGTVFLGERAPSRSATT